MGYVNTNNRGIHLNHEANRVEIHFLDLKISVMGVDCTEPNKFSNKFLTQADVFTKRFVEKGYSLESLQVTLGKVAQMKKADLLSDGPPD